jgi:hypothetical protein
MNIMLYSHTMILITLFTDPEEDQAQAQEGQDVDPQVLQGRL